MKAVLKKVKIEIYHYKKDEKIITIYSESKSRLNQAVEYWKKEKPIVIK